MELRRFKFITDDEGKRDKFNELVDSKNLSREELVLILTTISLNLKAFDTKFLVEELESRSEVKKVSVGLYKDYELTKKYCNPPQRNIEADVVLVIDYLDEM